MQVQEMGPGIEDVSAQYGYKAGEVLVKESFHGCVISKREMNGCDDSDFYALVWDDAKNAPEEIQYATTRCWTYANCATVDATPEVLAKYAAYRLSKAIECARQDAIDDCAQPMAGKVCTVVKGRKLKKGTRVVIRRVEAPTKWNAWSPEVIQCYVADAADPKNFSKWVHTNIENLEVENPSQYMPTEEAIVEAGKSLADSGCMLVTKKLGRVLAKHLR